MGGLFCTEGALLYQGIDSRSSYDSLSKYGERRPKWWCLLPWFNRKKTYGMSVNIWESAGTSSLQEFAEIAVFLGGQPHIPWCKASKFSSWCHVRYDLLWIPYYASPTNQIMLQYALNWGWNPSKHVWCLLTSSCFEVNQKTTMKIFTTCHLKRNRLSAKIITPRVRTVTNIINQIPAGRPHLQLWGCRASSSP